MNETKNSGLFLSDKLYNFFKFLTITLLPALGTLYFALAQIWNLPAGEEVLGTMMALQVFIGAIMGISTRQYENSGAKYVGTINIDESPEKETYSLELKDDPEMLKEKGEATFKVNPK